MPNLRQLSLLQFACVAVCAPYALAAQSKNSVPHQPVATHMDVVVREYLGTKEFEAAVNRGLDYLAEQQSADGHWPSGPYRMDVGVTGLCMMAFLTAGHRPGQGQYGVVIDAAVDFLAHNVQMDPIAGVPGLIRAPGSGGGPAMYGHGFALTALAEVYGMTHRQDFKPKLEAAVKLIEDTQNQDGLAEHDGGWRYQPVQNDADLSVTGVEMLALRACRNAGLKVSQATLDRAAGFVRRCVNADGGFSYQRGQNQSNPTRAGAGALALMTAGQRDSRECRGALNYLRAHPLRGHSDWAYRDHFHYAIFFVTQAMYQAGDDYWRKWYPPVRDLLVSTQDPEGSWSRSKGDSDACPEYATAMSVLVLQLPAKPTPVPRK